MNVADYWEGIMKREIVMVVLIISLIGCTSVDVKKIDSNEHPMKLVCIQENPKVWVRDFLAVVENGFIRHGIETEIFKDNPPPHCKYILTYIAGRSWDFAPFLNYAELHLKYGNKTIASATYKHSGGFALNKWASTESKMTPVIDQLLSDFHNGVRKDINNNASTTTTTNQIENSKENIEQTSHGRQQSSPTERLQELNRLKESGMISDEEYQEKRKTILNDL